MRKVAIIYATRNGQTEKIVSRMQATLEKQGCVVERWNVNKVKAQLHSTVDGVLIGGPVYAGRFHRSLFRWVKANKTKLAEKHLGYFTVSLNAADVHARARHDDDRLLSEFVEKAGLVPGFVASFAGALNYLEYNPLLRWQMRRIAKVAGGDTDVTRDYEYTQWASVESFAQEFKSQNLSSSFAITNRLPSVQSLNRYMRQFEKSTRTEILVDARPEELVAALKRTHAKDAKAAELLGTVRSLGHGTGAPKEQTFDEASRKFGVIPLTTDRANELLGGLIGQFWRLGFGIKRVSPTEFESFSDPDYTKVLTRFSVEAVNQTTSRLVAEMRIHSTDKSAEKKFGFYWAFLNPGIRIYMRSLLKAFKREAEVSHAHQPRTAFVEKL